MKPCTAGLLAACSRRSPKTVVGDQHQQIYTFRGAVNFLDLVMESSLTTVRIKNFLTQSFRFG